MKRISVFSLIAVMVLSGCGFMGMGTQAKATPTAIWGTLYVDPSQDLGPISPYVYGANFSLDQQAPANRIQDLVDSHITALRFPGGAWGDHNDLMAYPFQIDNFMARCKQMGALATISVRLLDGTPQAAAELVRYINIEKKYGVVYWIICFEPNLYDSLPYVTYDVDRFNREWRAIAVAMKAVDPSIKLMGPEISQWGTELTNTPKYPVTQTPSSQPRLDWMTEFLKANGDMVDVVTVHRYPLYAPSSNTPITVDNLRRNTLEWGPMVTYLRGMIKQITGRDLPVAFTEVNSDPSNVLSGEATPDSLFSGLWYADILGRMIQQNVFMVNQWAVAGTGGLGLLATNEIRPTYYVFQMYSHFGSEQVFTSTGMGYVDIFAAKSQDGSLTLMVVNLTDYAKHIALKIKGMTPSQAHVWLLDAKHKAEDMGVQAFAADGKLVLPERSVVLYVIGK